MRPQLQSTCNHLKNLYVKTWYVRLGVQIICAHYAAGGGQKRKRSVFEDEKSNESDEKSVKQKIALKKGIYSVSAPSVFMTPVTNYMLLYSTLLCKKIARPPGGHKKFMLTKLGGRNRIDPKKTNITNIIATNFV